jgi:hypothetical protein
MFIFEAYKGVDQMFAVTTLQEEQPGLGITDRDVNLVQLSGLCHDLGHGTHRRRKTFGFVSCFLRTTVHLVGPFSHAFEGWIRRAYVVVILIQSPNSVN